MRILRDECTPRVLKRRLTGRDVSTAQEMGWVGLKNGELLEAAEGQFGVFITADKNLRFQQNLARRKLAVVLLPSNRVPIVEALAPAVEAALDALPEGDFVEIPPPRK